MGETVKAKRTQVGGTTGTTIAVTRSVTVILDQPAESDMTFVLDAGSSYRKTLKATDAESLVDGERLLRFTGVTPSKRYRLAFEHAGGTGRALFLNRLISEITTAGKGPYNAQYVYSPMTVQVPAKLPNKYHQDTKPDSDLVQASPVLVALIVKDPKI